MQKTKIPWAEVRWNPIEGCAPKSEGCEHCYAAGFARRFGRPWGKPVLRPDRLEEPAHRRKASMVFVCTTSDIFHEDVPGEYVNKMLAMMTNPLFGGSHHTYMLLTKRPERLLNDPKAHPERFAAWKNIWLGVTAENHERYTERWRILRQIPAAVRFVSVEPMLGPVDIEACYDNPDWVIAGPETGQGKRPFRDEWLEELQEQCLAERIRFFDKRKNGQVRQWPGGKK